ncbi:hypothetical protein [Luteipulveratus halotolerans]|uniref:hypothetical protein n=1 Tax=Luteipulveratus halotolerans TaxID=1631356 RepID=UPI0026BBA40D
MVAGGLVGLMVVGVTVFVHHPGDHAVQVWSQVAAFGVLLALLWWLRRTVLSRRVLAGVLLGGCALLQVVALTAAPSSSDDDFRYVWDAKVQLSGTDPYRYAPVDAELTPLRGEFAFPTERPCPAHRADEVCTEINRPTVHTIYPPVAQNAFVAMRVAGAGHDSHRPLQVSAAIGVLAVALLLVRWSRTRGTPLWWVAVWALNPLVAVEATNNAHIDWLAVLLSVLGLLALDRRRTYAAGLAFGAAVATKLFPVVLLATAGRRPSRMTAGALTVLVLGYLPHVVAVGPAVLGYLPGYLREEEYADGGRYLVTGLLVGDAAAAVVTPLLLAGGLLALWWWGDAERPECTAVTAVGLYLALTTPNYPWYPLLLVVLVAMTGRLRWLWLCLAPTLTYFAPALPWDWSTTRLVSYVGAVGLVVAAQVRDRRTPDRSDDGRVHQVRLAAR